MNITMIWMQAFYLAIIILQAVNKLVLQSFLALWLWLRQRCFNVASDFNFISKKGIKVGKIK